MERAKSKGRASPRVLDIEHLLEEYYGKLQSWGTVLTRGDRAMAQEIVHDLCLHFIVAKPDLSEVVNLDGYLYTCLRHIYLSFLARTSREALQTINIADFDTFQFALNARTSDGLLDLQNELRRICNYAVWRKDSSKSASYFVLLFFHGYARREVAAVARLPISAIYNKLKVARAELTSHLAASGKLRIVSRDVPPSPELRVGAVSSAELFDELKQIIFAARRTECLSEESLLAQYNAPIVKPIPCGLLSHIVSCQGCLSVLDRHFERATWHDHEPPGSSTTYGQKNGSEPDAQRGAHFDALMTELRRQKERIYEHRPRTLSIAINGRIVAFHDVQSERSTLASRAEHPEAVQFVEVFTDQQIRLALLPIENLPPGGPPFRHQDVKLSDGRRLELTVSFDGQGLHSEVTYLDPALAAESPAETADDTSFVTESDSSSGSLFAFPAKSLLRTIGDWIAGHLLTTQRRFGLAWVAVLFAVLGSTAYLFYRHVNPSLDARMILHDSVKIEAADEQGEAEHQTLRFDALDASGRIVWQGIVDTWKDPSSGRTMRRIYNSRHQLLAAEWHRKDGNSGSFTAQEDSGVSQSDRVIAESAFWKVDVSARGFQAMAAQHLEIRSAGSGYRLSGASLSSAPPHLVSATLLLSHHLRFLGETLRVGGGYAFTEVRFVETRDQHLPSAAVPDAVFDAANAGLELRNLPGGHTMRDEAGDLPDGMDARLVQAEVDVLYRLSKLGADVGEPIQISRTSNRHLRVTGTITSEVLRRQIVDVLQTMPEHQLVQIELAAQASSRVSSPPIALAMRPAQVYDVAPTMPPADPILRRSFAAKGLAGKQLDSAVTQFSHDALDHAQRALQHAYALDRLGTTFTPYELRVMGPIAQQQWTEMVAEHSSALQTELDLLQRQITQLSPDNNLPPRLSRPISIETPADFGGSAKSLLVQIQKLNRAVGSAFSAGISGANAQTAQTAIDAVWASIPVQEAKQFTEFASRLGNVKDRANRSLDQNSRMPR